MGKIKDLTGQRFGKLTAIEPTAERRNGSVVWKCRCDCGSEKLVAAINLVVGNTKSCGCLNDLTGRRFGWLTAIEPTADRSVTSVIWRCKCDCGSEKLVSAKHLVSGAIQSCGCYGRSYRPKKELEGQRFGMLTVIEETGKRKGSFVVWRCKCDCGNELVYASSRELTTGLTHSCGCVNDLTGMRFGKLTVIEPTEERRYGCVVWKCRCDCGSEKFVNTTSLVKGFVKSCGCLNDLTGMRFGKLTAIEPTEERSDSSVKWRCVCDCGNEKLVSGQSLVRGYTKSCGCLRRKTLNPDEIVFE